METKSEWLSRRLLNNVELLKSGDASLVSKAIANLEEISTHLTKAVLPTTQSDLLDESKIRQFAKTLGEKTFPNDVNRAYDCRCGAYDGITEYLYSYFPQEPSEEKNNNTLIK